MLRNGEGKQTTATDTTALWTVSKGGANGISVYVAGDTAVYFLVNCTEAEFNTLYDAGKAIRVQPSMNFYFNGDKLQNIQSVCYRTLTGSSDVDFAAF